ncbi:TPA: hypothetical protein R1906_002581, partial [Staphylococcus delphini]|nr:hypothetical protein [Staphylococcus delphini]
LSTRMSISLYSQTSIDSLIPMLILLLMSIDFATLGLTSTCLLISTDFLRLIATSLRLQTSTDSSMTTLILLLMSICFPILEAMSIYLQMLIDFSQLIATSLHLPISIDLSTCLLTPIGFLLLTVISLCLPISIDLSTRMSISLYSQTSIGSSIPMLISPYLLICSSMLTSILLLMLIDFPTLGLMSTCL